MAFFSKAIEHYVFHSCSHRRNRGRLQGKSGNPVPRFPRRGDLGENPPPFVGNAPPPAIPGPPMGTPIAQVAPLPRGFVTPVRVEAPGAAVIQPPMVPIYPGATPEARVDILEVSPERSQMIPQASPMLPVYHNQALNMEVKSPSQLVAAPPPPIQVHYQEPAGAILAPIHPYQMSMEQPPPQAPRQLPETQIQYAMTTEHDSNHERYPLRDEDRIKELESPLRVSTGMATKSLSALKSRKEEIIDHLQDLVGPEEVLKIKSRAKDEPVVPLASSAAAKRSGETAAPAHSTGYYSIWTSKSIATISVRNSEAQRMSEEREVVAPSSAEEKSPTTEANEIKFVMPEEDKEDEVIPFTDTPHISRFGPISRKSATLMQAVTPSQSQAVISDEPTPTAVVRHSKHMTRQVPSLAALYHQNGKL
jgi:hypothetical protein